jgi:hypothetical protein
LNTRLFYKKAKLEKKESSVSDLPDDVDTSFPTEINADAKTSDGRKFNKTIESSQDSKSRKELTKVNLNIDFHDDDSDL